MFKYDIYSHEDGNGFEIELSDYPNKKENRSFCNFTFYLNSLGLDTELNEEIETSYKTDTFLSPSEVEVIDGIIHLQGNPIYN